MKINEKPHENPTKLYTFRRFLREKVVDWSRLCSVKSIKYCVQEQSCNQPEFLSAGLENPCKHPKPHSRWAPQCWKELHRQFWLQELNFALFFPIHPSQQPGLLLDFFFFLSDCLSDGTMWEGKLGPLKQKLSRHLTWRTSWPKCLFSGLSKDEHGEKPIYTSRCKENA